MDIQILKDRLDPQTYTTDTEIIAPWLREWRDKYFGRTPLMLMPRSTQEVASMVRICHKHNISIVPQGGNTGLVGGQTPMGEVLLSTRKLNRIRDVNPTTQTLCAEAGVTLTAVQEAAARANRKFPLSLASEGTCTIGGNASTNAGGVHVLKYGTTKDLVLGVEAVLADGRIFHGLSDLRKDNTGYDLSKLFLGAEGTLGIITAVSLKLFVRPGHTQRVMVGLESPQAALDLMDTCQVGRRLAMFEVMPRIGLELVTTHIPEQRDPFGQAHPWYALIDFEVDTEDEGHRLSETIMSDALDAGLIRDAVIARSEAQAHALLALRENMSAAQKPFGGSVKQDVTVPVDKLPLFLSRADQAVSKYMPGVRPVAFGHFGDGNIHYNVSQPANMEKATFLEHWQDISDIVFDVVEGLGGSISAEHGIGVMKRQDLSDRADPVKLALMRSVKQTLDPKGIMNPRVMI